MKRLSNRVTSAAVVAVALLLIGAAAACRRPLRPARLRHPGSLGLTIAPETVTARYEYVGQAAASRSVEVRAQVQA